MLQLVPSLHRICVVAVFIQCSVVCAEWPMHVIDDASQGADGVKAVDINGDGRLDLVTGWEEGGRIRVCLQPELESVDDRWPAVTVGSVASPEDAVFCDLDRDGVFEVISCCEGTTPAMYVHRCIDSTAILDDVSWETSEIPLGMPRRQWMFATPIESGIDDSVQIVCGAKGNGAEIGVLSFHGDLNGDYVWNWETLHPAGWIMSIEALDFDSDGDQDILYSDRRGSDRGVHWFEQMVGHEWQRHTLGGVDYEVMFLDAVDLNEDGVLEVVSAARDVGIIVLSRSGDADSWEEQVIPLGDNCGTGKGIAIFDVDHDGDNDIVFSCENSAGKIGVGWLAAPDWGLNDISGTADGVKFDLLLPMDVNADGWIDVITCEERDNLGLIWYENPGE